MLNEWCATSGRPGPAIVSSTAANTARRVFMTSLHIWRKRYYNTSVTGYTQPEPWLQSNSATTLPGGRQRVGEEGIVGGEHEKLASIQHVRNRRVRHVAQHGISTIGQNCAPQYLSRDGLVRHHIACGVPGEH